MILLKMPPGTRPLDTQPGTWSLFGLPVSDQIFRDGFTSSKKMWRSPASLPRCYQSALLVLLICKKKKPTSESAARGPPLHHTLSGDNLTL